MLIHLAAISYFWQHILLSLPVRILRFFFVWGLFLLVKEGNLYGQTTGPEQDCDHAIPVCQTQYVQNASYQGIGTQQEIGPNSCLENGENNSVWYIFTVTVAGTLEFSIVPQ